MEKSNAAKCLFCRVRDIKAQREGLKADGYRPKLILYPLTQRLWDAIPRGVEHTSDVPPGYFASAPSAPMYASPC